MKCYDCAEWRGRCACNKWNRIAKSEACELFKPKQPYHELIVPLMVPNLER